MEIWELLMVCALALAALGAVVGIGVARQGRSFANHLRDEEREMEEERRREFSRGGNIENNDESGARL